MKTREKKDIPLPLDVFSPSTGVQSLGNVLRKSHIMPHPSANLAETYRTIRVSALARSSRKRPLEFFLRNKGERLIKSADNAIYEGVRKVFQLKSEKENPITFWERHMNRANDVITGLVDRIIPQDRNLYGLLDETAIVRSPGKLLMHLNSPQTSERLCFELNRQVAIALVSAQLEAQKRKASHKLKEVRDWLNVDLFDHGRQIGEGTNRKVRSIHDPITNQILYLEGTSDNPNDANVEGVKREQTMRMKYVDGVGFVVSNPRRKLSKESIKKSLLMALEKKNGNSNAVASSVKDRIGMIFTVADEFYNTSGKVDLLMTKVKQILKQRFNLTDDAFKIDDENHHYEHQENRQSSFRRFNVKFPDLDDPLEIMFTAMGEQIDRDNLIGEIDEKGIPHTEKHQAHKLYEVARDLRAFKLLFPSGVATLYGNIDYDKLTSDTYARTISEIKNSHLVN